MIRAMKELQRREKEEARPMTDRGAKMREKEESGIEKPRRDKDGERERVREREYHTRDGVDDGREKSEKERAREERLREKEELAIEKVRRDKDSERGKERESHARDGLDHDVREKSEKDRSREERLKDKDEFGSEKLRREKDVERSKERDFHLRDGVDHDVRDKSEKSEKERAREERMRDKEGFGIEKLRRDKYVERGKEREFHRREALDHDIRPSYRDRSDKQATAVTSGQANYDLETHRENEERKIPEFEGASSSFERAREKQRHDGVEDYKGKKRIKEFEKDKEEGSVEGEGLDKEAVIGSGVQHRKRMLRPRVFHQATPREARSRFRLKDFDGWQSRPDAYVLSYRIGEGMQDLKRIRAEFDSRASSRVADSDVAVADPLVEIQIPAELATTSNRQVLGSQLWGTDVYTDDSDIVAVLMHTGYYSPTSGSPPSAIQELRVTIRVLLPQESYISTLRNSVRSRAWGSASACSFSVDRCWIVKAGGGKVDLEPHLAFTPPVAPTLAPISTERSMTTRASSTANNFRHQRFVQEVTIQYNLCNEPWLKYNMNTVADQGLKKSQYTSARVKMGDVLYVETQTNRYELSYDESSSKSDTNAAGSSEPQADSEKGKEKEEGTASATDKAHPRVPSAPNGDKVQCERYRWARCKYPYPHSYMHSIGVPLPVESLHILEKGLLWEEVQWSPLGVCVRGKEYPLCRAQFFSFKKSNNAVS